MTVQHKTLGLLAAGVLALLPAAQAGVSFEVQFNDPGSAHAAWYAALASHTVATGQDWVSRFDLGLDSTLTVQISFAAIATANGRSDSSAYVGTDSGLAIWEQSAAHEIKTGVDINGAAPDILFTIGNVGYLQNELWFDTDPVAQTAAVPLDKTDARSVLLHEYGHAFGFNGWRDGLTGALPGTYASTFDLQVQPGNMGLVFAGANAVANYGGTVPLTLGNYSHIGNSEGDLALLDDLMNGVVFNRGARYQISALDLAIMQDAGLPLAAAVPEPTSWALMALGIVAVVVPTARRRHAG